MSQCNLTTLIAAFAVLAFAAPATAQEVSNTHHHELGDDYTIRVAGLWHSERDADVDVENYGQRVGQFEAPIESGYGMAAEFSMPLDTNFAVGARLQFQAWSQSDFSGVLESGTILKLSVVPKLRFPVGSRPLAVYVAVPIGVNAFLPGDDLEMAGFNSGGGVNGGAFLGVEQVIANQIGVFGELGAMGTVMNTKLVGSVTDYAPLDLSYSDLAVNVQVGAFYHF